jgi:hypothetical protein
MEMPNVSKNIGGPLMLGGICEIVDLLYKCMIA